MGVIRVSEWYFPENVITSERVNLFRRCKRGIMRTIILQKFVNVSWYVYGRDVSRNWEKYLAFTGK